MRKSIVVLVCFVMAPMLFGAYGQLVSEQLLDQYFAIHGSLAADSTRGVAEAASRIKTISQTAAAQNAATRAQLQALSDAAAKLQSADLKAARSGFGELSRRMIAYVQAAASQNKPHQFYCPMAKESWLQPDKNTRNPYYGSSMLKCGTMVQ